MLLLELVDLMINLVQRTNLIQRKTHNTTLLCNGLENALTNPPYSVRYKLESTSLIKLLSGLDQSDITFID